MRVYFADLSAYNAGRLHGVWIDLEGKDEFDVGEEIDAMLDRSPVSDAEEVAIHDFEGPVNLHELTSVEELVEIQEALDELGDVYHAALGAGWEPGYAAGRARDHFLGYYDSLEDWAYEYFDGEAPGDFYVDWEAVGEDQVKSGEVTAVEHDNHVYVFDNR